MARVTGDFQSEVIRAYKGVLDFYYWRGIGVVRSWPRKPVLPRNPAVQAAGQDFRDNSRALSTLPIPLQISTAEEVRDTAYTWKDAWTTTIYGHGLTWTLRQAAGNAIPQNELALKVSIFRPGNDATIVENINTTNYRSYYSTTFWVPFSVVPYTHYRILIAGNSTQAGQNAIFDCGIDGGAPVPFHSPGPALTVPNSYDRRDSGWLSIDNIPATDQICALIMKGSNGTVDISWNLAEITFIKA